MKTSVTSSAGCLIQNKEGKILVFKRGEPLNDYSFPKGKIEKGESAEQAAVRETKEETGLEIKIIKELGEVKYEYYWEPTDTTVKKSVVYFLAEVFSGKLDKSLNNEDSIKDMFWVGKKELNKLFNDRENFKEILNRI